MARQLDALCRGGPENTLGSRMLEASQLLGPAEAALRDADTPGRLPLSDEEKSQVHRQVAARGRFDGRLAAVEGLLCDLYAILYFQALETTNSLW